MGLKITPIVFTPQTLIKSADMNSNFTATTTATNFDGNWETSNNTLVLLSCQDTTVPNVTGSSAIPVLSIQPSATSLSRHAAIGYISGGTLQIAVTSVNVFMNKVINDGNGGTYWVNPNPSYTVSSASGGGTAVTYNYGWPGIPLYVFASVVGDSAISSPSTTSDWASIGTIGSTTATIYITDNTSSGFTSTANTFSVMGF